MRTDWKGIYPALSTPCDDSGALDEQSLRSENFVGKDDMGLEELVKDKPPATEESVRQRYFKLSLAMALVICPALNGILYNYKHVVFCILFGNGMVKS